MAEWQANDAESWRLPERARPPLLGELVERIDEALAIAHASEAAVMTVGSAALDAAEQARRAAELAERASAMVAAGAAPAVHEATPTSAGDGPGEDELGDFSARADRIAERLQRLQRLPLAGGASVAR
ncbi:MAG TPA: hypothetical protein VHQ43_00120 [Solirubrobacterales bacterium]|nr:hypothetical protein [Solirubrobacterales bacterium]